MTKKIDLKIWIEQKDDGTSIVHFDKRSLMKASLADLMHDINESNSDNFCSKDASGLEA